MALRRTDRRRLSDVRLTSFDRDSRRPPPPPPPPKSLKRMPQAIHVLSSATRGHPSIPVETAAGLGCRTGIAPPARHGSGALLSCCRVNRAPIQARWDEACKLRYVTYRYSCVLPYRPHEIAFGDEAEATARRRPLPPPSDRRRNLPSTPPCRSTTAALPYLACATRIRPRRRLCASAT